MYRMCNMYFISLNTPLSLFVDAHEKREKATDNKTGGGDRKNQLAQLKRGHDWWTHGWNGSVVLPIGDREKSGRPGEAAPRVGQDLHAAEDLSHGMLRVLRPTQNLCYFFFSARRVGKGNRKRRSKLDRNIF